MKKRKLAIGLLLGSLSLSGAAWALQWWTFTFDTGDSRGFTQDNPPFPGGDWAVNSYKGECYSSGAAMGVSATPNSKRPDLRAHDLLCTDDHTVWNYNNHSHSLLGPYDDRAPTNIPDWDPQHTKAECGLTESVVGVAQSDDGNRIMTTILCSVLWNTIECDETNWQFLPFSHTQDNRMSGVPTPDWDSGYSKNECAPGWILKGVSAVHATGEISGILCCHGIPSGNIH
jgi:hypothetical protein